MEIFVLTIKQNRTLDRWGESVVKDPRDLPNNLDSTQWKERMSRDFGDLQDHRTVHML